MPTVSSRDGTSTGFDRVGVAPEVLAPAMVEFLIGRR